MASLKDMRVRIASTKATQKITKAMQMVAASKLRRAQTAAEAARPYAERMDAVISNIAGAAAGSGSAPILLAGTGSDKVHLLLVCTGERGLSGAFNSSIVRLARERALSLMNQGKDVKIFCVGRKGFEQLRRQFDKQIVGNVELRSVKQLGFTNADDVGRMVRNVEAASADAKTLLSGLKEGDGLLGGLLHDDQMRQDGAVLVSNLASASANLVLLSSNLNRHGIFYKPRPPRTTTPSVYPGKVPFK